ncbi:glycolate oxidase subunit GlcF [Thiobacillus sp.]|uniref:glycolate oxidase subunit GlcF n=1 Tax=Thiobacillus sp. TaxID=924 RepID=UPI001ACF9670|nr:glycolate oxidase subunit GlcF [Thiobacillus sp.]MBN8778755.1 glycolate oxidase subunit GlcF [Thiobacillus sp.]
MKIELAEPYRDTELGREAESLLLSCVQCGQCTFTCPTFRLLDDEWDGPRGRIYLIKQFMEGKEPTPDTLELPAYTLSTLEGRTLSANLQLHLDRCLGCRSCETSCPQGVRYGRLLDIGRELVEKESPRPLKEKLARRALRAVVPYRYRFTALLRTGQALRRFLPEDLRARIPQRRQAGVWPDRPHGRRMLIWQGCVQPGLAPDINAASARVLDRFGIRLIPASDGCCGALSHHMAETDEARAFMRKNIDALWPHIEAGAEALVLTASGCGMHFREYGQLLHDDPQYRDKAARLSELTRDIAEIVAEEWNDDPLHALPAPPKPRRIVFQSSCSLQHGEKLNGVVEKLLKRAGFKLLPVRYPFMCCGSAGAYSLLQPTLSESLRERKLETLLVSRPEAIATANIGCLTHLALASPVPVSHWIELLDKTFQEADSQLRGHPEPHMNPASANAHS